jgi:predicted naringenin-chalcone synthase
MKPNTETEMVWQIGNYGFALRLSPRIPEHLAKAAPPTLARLFPKHEPEFWAIHPGGSAILDRLVKSFDIDESEIAASRAVLRNYGNLSSATILFVLAELQHSFIEEAQSALPVGSGTNSYRRRLTGVAMAFGPGLVIEMARLAYVFPVAPVLSPSKLPVSTALALA